MAPPIVEGLGLLESVQGFPSMPMRLNPSDDQLPAYEALNAAADRMGMDAARFPLVTWVGVPGVSNQITMTVDEMIKTFWRDYFPYPASNVRRDRVIDQWVEEQMADHIPEGEDE